MRRIFACALMMAGRVSAQASTAHADPFATEGQRGSVTPYLWGMSVDGDATVGPISAGVDISFSDLLDKLNFALMVEGDVGGFGVGSDFSWQAIGLYARDILLGQTPATLLLGYRALGQDYTTGGVLPFKIDTTYHGPVFGLTIAF